MSLLLANTEISYKKEANNMIVLTVNHLLHRKLRERQEK